MIGKLLIFTSSLIALTGCDSKNQDDYAYMMVPDVCRSDVIDLLKNHEKLVADNSYKEHEFFIPKKLENMFGNFATLILFDTSKIPQEEMFTNEEYLAGFFDNCLYKKRKKIDLLNDDDVLELQELLKFEGESVKYVRHLEGNSVIIYWGDRI